jgi:hypothetical protein
LSGAAETSHFEKYKKIIAEINKELDTAKEKL